MEKPPETVDIKLKRILPKPVPAPQAVHKFLYHRIGATLILETGFFEFGDFREVLGHARRTPAKAATAELHVSHQFQLSQQAIYDLFEVVDAMREDMNKTRKESEK